MRAVLTIASRSRDAPLGGYAPEEFETLSLDQEKEAA
jgi:hypothetical protein